MYDEPELELRDEFQGDCHAKLSGVVMSGEFIEIRRGLRIPLSEIVFRTSRSSGPGGQHVNKAETRVELLFDVASSPSLSPIQRRRIWERLASHMDGDGVLHIVNQATRSQWKNKQGALDRLRELLRTALRPVKKRINTKRTAGSIERRLRSKKIRSERKRKRSPREHGDNEIG